MKIVFTHFRTLLSVAFIVSSLFITACTPATVKCTTETDDNHGSATNDCDENATCTKFQRSGATMAVNGNVSNGIYPISITQGVDDYTINVYTNWGFTAEISQYFMFSVSKNTATMQASPVNYAGGWVGPVSISLNTTTNKMSVTLTFSGFGVGVDGTLVDVEQ